jgi:hypothetical protein
MKGIIQHTNIETDASESYSQAPEKRLCCAQHAATPSLFGGDSLMTASTCEQESDRAASTARHSETNQGCSLPTLYARRAQSLLIAGLIAGITPMSIRKRFGADCRDAAFLPLDGDMSESEAGESEPEAEN